VKRLDANVPEQDLLDQRNRLLGGEPAKRQRRSAPENVLWATRPFEVARVDGLRDDIRPVRMQRKQKIRLLLGRRENLLGQAPVVMCEMRVDTRVEVRPATREPPSSFTGVDGARERERPPV
jgi:hypothetical protein